MPKQYGEIVEEFKRYKALEPDTDLDLADYALAADADEAEPQRQAAYNARGLTKGVKDVNEFINRAFEFTGAPEAGRVLGRGAGSIVDKVLGTGVAPTFEEVGGQLPRAVAEGVLSLTPAAMVGRGISTAAKAAGYGSAALQGGAQTDSPILGGAIGAGSLAASNYLVPKATTGTFRSVQDFIKGATEIPSPTSLLPDEQLLNQMQIAKFLQQPARAVAPAAAAGVGLATEAGINEATRQASLSVGPNRVGLLDAERNPLTEENIAAQVGMSLAGVPQAAKGIIQAPRTNISNVIGLNEWINQREAYKAADLGYLGGEFSTDELQRMKQLGGVEDRAIRTKPDRDVDLPPGVDDWSYYLDGDSLDQAIKSGGGKLRFTVALRNQLDALTQARFEGRADAAAQSKAAIERIQRHMLKMGMTKDPVQATALQAEALDAVVRLTPPSNPRELADFLADLNTLLEQTHNNTLATIARLEQELPTKPDKIIDERTREAWVTHEKARKELEEFKKLAEETKFKTWDPRSRSKETIQGLGLLDHITEQHLYDRYQFQLDRGLRGDSAYRAVLQQVMGEVYNRVEAQLEVRKGQQVETEFSKSQQDLQLSDKAAAEALAFFPPEIRDGLIGRTADIWMSQGGEFTTRSGTMRHGYPRDVWNLILVQAANTYEASSGTVRLHGKMTTDKRSGRTFFSMPKRGGRDYIINVSELFKADEHGRYAFEPGLREGKVSEGLRRSPLEVDMPRSKEGDELDLRRLDDDDEDAFFHDIEQKESAAFLGKLDVGKQLGSMKGRAGPAEGEIPGQEQVRGETSSDLEYIAGALREAVAKEPDLYNKFKDLFVRRTMTGLESGDRDPALTALRQKHIKLALEAILEDRVGTGTGTVGPKGKEVIRIMREAGKAIVGSNEHQQFRNAMRSLIGQPGINDTFPAGLQGADPYKKRIYQFLSKLVDPKRLEGLMGGGGRTEATTQAGAPRDFFYNRVAAELERAITPTLTGRGAKFQPDAEGRVKTKLLFKALQDTTPKEILEFYKARGIEEFLKQDKVNAQEFVKWVRENTPQVEVKQLIPGENITPEKREFAELRHSWYDNLSVRQREALVLLNDQEQYGKPVTQNNKYILSSLSEQDLKNAKRYNELADITAGQFSEQSDAATGRYGVEPKDLKDMPGAVDILVRVPSFEDQGLSRSEERDYIKGGAAPKSRPLFKGPHFGDSDVNVLASIRGYLETLPNGEKVFHVFEVQSDWGQQKAKFDPSREAGARSEDPNHPYRFNNKVADHPLLAHYETLALKTAIQHARSVGAKYIAISDAETAMMTEGHDRVTSNHIETTPENIRLAKELYGTPRYGQLSADQQGAVFAIANGHRLEPTNNYFIDGLGQAGLHVIRRISQEPGMRAAYDQRLPAIAKRLTRDAGQVVDFGKHVKAMPDEPGASGIPESFGSLVFKDATGKAKDNVTARLYNITQADDPQPLFTPQAGKPEVIDEPSGMRSTFTNIPAEGQFVPDVIRTFRDAFKRYLRGTGYSGSLLDTYTELATSLALTKKGFPLQFYKLSQDSFGGGLARWENDKLARVGSRVPDSLDADPIHRINDMLRVLSHEMAHIDQFITEGNLAKPDAMSDMELRAAKNLINLGRALKPEERHAILDMMEQALIPKEYRPDRRTPDGKFQYGAGSAEEFATEVNGFMFHALMGGATSKGPKSFLEVLKWMPEEITEFAHGRYRTVADILEGVRLTLQNPMVRKFNFQPEIPGTSVFLGEAFEAAIQSARNMSKLRDVDHVKAQTKHFLGNLSPGSALGLSLPTEAVWQHVPGPGGTVPTPADRSRVEATIRDTHQRMFGRESWYSRWFTPFTNRMVRLEREGNPLARDIMYLSQDINPSVGRLLSAMREPFLTKDKFGRYVPDKHGELLRKLNDQPDGAWRGVLNQVRAIQNEQEGKQMFLPSPQGLQVNPELQADWDRISRPLSAADKQVVMNFSAAIDNTFQTSAALMIGQLQKSVQDRVAAMLMTMNLDMQYDQAKSLSAEVMAGFETANLAPIQQKLSPQQFERVKSLLGGPDGLYTKWLDTKKHLERRPGYSTERLPGDYMVEYINKAKEKKYLGAKNRRHAEQLQQRLIDEGEKGVRITDKKDVDDYTDFDDPVDVLSKFEKVEGQIWKRVVDEHEAKFGQAAAEALRAAFVPGEASSKELLGRRLEGYLIERKGKVDRPRFDYIDAMTEYTTKLATSLTYRSVRNQMNMILSDPRLRDDPGFQTSVRSHFDQIMAANPKWLGEMRSLMSGYFLVANVSSAMVEGTQSVTMTIPNLLRMGAGMNNGEGMTVPQAYASLGRAVTEGFKNIYNPGYLKVAQAAERRDASGASWTAEETRAWVYERAQKDGLLETGVINDPDYGRDQRAADTARFGHGAYGKTTLGELLTNKLYVANQILMSLYNVTSHMNNRVAFIAGADQAHQMGLRGEAAYRHAQTLRSLSTLSGGKVNAPGVASQFQSPLTRSAWGLASTLQSYGLGAVATLAELGREAIGRAPGLTLVQRRQARKAFATALTTQVGIGGALSLPFAAASLAFLEEFFGVEAGAAVREGLASLAGEDEELGSVIADLALSGGGSMLTGFDLSSRVGVSNLFGTSSYRGFNAKDVFGPGGSVIGNAMEALNLFGQAEPMKAATALVPVAFKAPFEAMHSLSKFGDTSVRDQSGSLLYEPTDMETMGSLLGFRPKVVSQKRQAQRFLALSEESHKRRESQVLDQAAQSLLAGDSSAARNLVMDRWSADPIGTDRRALYRSIVDRAVASQMEKDLLAGGSYANAERARDITGTYSQEVVPRRSESEMLRMKLQLGALLGPEALPMPSAFRRAQLVDRLTSDGATRSEAVRLADFLSGR